MYTSSYAKRLHYRKMIETVKTLGSYQLFLILIRKIYDFAKVSKIVNSSVINKPIKDYELSQNLRQFSW